MKLYCTRVRKKDDKGNDVFASPFKYVCGGVFVEISPSSVAQEWGTNGSSSIMH